MGSRRAEWFRLRRDHPAVDPMNPTAEFARDVLTAAGMDAAVWDEGTEREALRAYIRALTLIHPDHSWASALIDADAHIATEVSVCVDMGVPYEEFLQWSPDSQDLAIATVLRRRDLCPAGRHPRDAMSDPDAVAIARVYCGACAREHELEQQFRDAGPDAQDGWSLEVTRVPR